MASSKRISMFFPPSRIEFKPKYKVIDDPEIIAKKNELRRALKEEYLRKFYNPHADAHGQGGRPFDPAVQRYVAVQYSQDDFKRHTPETTTLFTVGLALPFAGIMWLFWNHRENLEKIYRSGQVSYFDRKFKFK